ncbi:uncharacterized protein (DUF58 family) [Brevibacterium pityocampae]
MTVTESGFTFLGAVDGRKRINLAKAHPDEDTQYRITKLRTGRIVLDPVEAYTRAELEAMQSREVQNAVKAAIANPRRIPGSDIPMP